MSYSANQYNYATPLNSSGKLIGQKISGVQMFDISTAAPGYLGGDPYSLLTPDADNLTSDYIPVVPNTVYTYSTWGFTTGLEAWTGWYYYNTSNTAIGARNVSRDVFNGIQTISFTTPADCYFIRIGSRYLSQPGVYVMLNAGSNALPWEPYNNGEAYPPTNKLFTLNDNVLDGSYFPITGDAGLWGNTLSDTSGNLATPFVVTVNETLAINSYRVMGSADCYPVAFTVRFYNGSTLLYTITETSNNKAEYVHILASTLNVTSVVTTVTKISKADATARLYNLYDLPYIKRIDSLKAKTTEYSELSLQMFLNSADTIKLSQSHGRNMTVVAAGYDNIRVLERSSSSGMVTVAAYDTAKLKVTGSTSILNTIDKRLDTLRVKQEHSTHILNTIDVTTDRLVSKVLEAETRVTNIIDVTKDTLRVSTEAVPVLTNVHTRMKEPYREIYGKVYITYTDTMLENDVSIVASTEAYNSVKEQVSEVFEETDVKFFTLYKNDLSGNYVVSSVDDYVGWTSAVLSKSDGTFDTPQTLELSMHARPIVSLSVTFDKDNVARDFTVTFTSTYGISTVKTFVDNREATVMLIEGSTALADIEKITFSITRVANAGTPANILNAPLSSTVLYKGYANVSELMSIDLLEELTYEDDVEALGGVSANEVTVVLDNSSKDFFFNSTSIVSKQLKRNRKIVPWLGVEVIPGEIEWYTLGTFWSYKWDVPANGLTATVVGFDTIGLLGLTTYFNHQTQVNKSIGQLIEYVLDDAKEDMPFIEYIIDESLYDVVIPYAWFDYSSHAAALRKISMCYPMHIYCDRQGRICAAPQKLHLDYYYDTWSDSTNVIEKNYSSLYTALPNVVNVTVTTPMAKANEQLVQDDVPFTVSDGEQRILSFSSPYLSDINVSVVCDSTVAYTYDVYSWGITFYFTGHGEVRSVICTGTCVDTSTQSIVTKRDIDKIKLDGAVTRDVTSDFIQTADLANNIIERLFNLSENDKYDAEVTYRGDIALTINDPILLQGGIAPDNRYNIKRHQLNWSGYLTGSADLNT